MSRSRKKYPKFSGSASEKWDKQKANRKLRHRNKMRCLKADEDTIFLLLREVSNNYVFQKDGYFTFDPEKNPEWMRK